MTPVDDADPHEPELSRILMVVDSLEVGGGEQQVADIAVALRQRGYAVTVACSTGGMLSQMLAQQNVPVRILMNRLVKRRVSIGYALRLRALVREDRFHLVHAHLYASVAAAAIATRGMDVPLVVTEHSEAAWRGPRARFISRWAYRRAARVIAVSRGIRGRLIAQDRVSPECVAVIPNAVALRTDDVTEPLTAIIPAAWREGPLIGVVARLQPEKGVHIFLEAIPLVLSGVPTAHVLLIGDGPLRGELEERVKQLGLADRVHFLGFKANARSFIARLDLLVLPSLSEGTPLVILEAMAACVPVVASDVGGIPEQIRHGQEGLLVPAGDPTRLAEACLQIVQDPSRAREIGQAGHRRASCHFGYETMLRRIEAVYRAVLDRREAPPNRAADLKLRTR
jgi:glycosyltransferase involved in cell wall biosynthesis